MQAPDHPDGLLLEPAAGDGDRYPLGEGDHGRRIRGPGHIRMEIACFPSFLPDGGDGFLPGGIIDVGDDDPCTFPCEEECRFPADTAAAARDERCLVG